MYYRIPDRDLEKGLVKVVNDYDLIHMYDMSKMYGGIELYLAMWTLNLSRILVDPDPSTVSDGTSKKRATPHKRYCNVFTEEEMVSWAEKEAEEEAMLRKGKEKTNVGDKRKEKMVVESDSENDGMIEDTDSDDSDYSNKSFDYLSAGEEELIQLRTRKANRSKIRPPPIPDMAAFASTSRATASNRNEVLVEHDDFIADLLRKLKDSPNLQDPFVGLKKLKLQDPEAQAASKASYPQLFNKIMEQIKAANPGAYQYLIDKDPKTWSRAFFEVDRGCEAVENGFSECFNSVLVSVRNKPLLTMLEAIRVIVIERMNTMRKISATWTDDICPSILKRIDLMKNHTRFWHVIHTGGESFEVRSGSDALKVDLSTRTCSCRMWQLSGLPCVHAISAIFKINKMPEEYVPNWFRKHFYYATYHNYLSPVGGIDFWPDQSQFSKVLPPKPRVMPGRPRKKRIRASHEGGSRTRVSKVGGQVTCQNCFQVGHNKKGCKASSVQKPVMEKKKAGRPRKADAANVGGSASPLGGSANPMGRSGSGVGRSGSGVCVNANPLGRSTTLTDEEGVNESANQHDDDIDVGGSVQGTGGSCIGRGVVRGCDIPGLKWSPPQKRAFNRVGGCSFSTRPRHQNVRRGFVRWFGNDDSRGVSYDMNNDTQGNQVNQTSSQAIPSDQGSQTEVEIPTQEMPSQATNDVPPEVQRVRQQRPIVPRQRLPSERIMKRKLARKVHGEGSSQETAMHLD
ncbi:pentatricopeptide repeat-containing protein [Tanacetum coccineum]